MKLYSEIIHKTIAYLRIELVFISLKKYLPFLIKFIPLHTSYLSPHIRMVKRANSNFKLDISDYMQWYIFADLEDLSWRVAKESLKDESVMIDVGANCGAFTIKLAQYGYSKGVKNFKIYSFEPNPVVYDKLLSNLKLNPHLVKYIHIIKAGLGEHSEFLSINIPLGNTGGGKIVNNKDDSNQIEIIKLDDFTLKENFEHLNFIKIDVEGFEMFVINGGITTIEKFLPNIYIEITDEWLKDHGHSGKMILNHFSNLGYKLFREENNSFIKIRNDDETINLGQYNMLGLSPIYNQKNDF